MIEGVLFVGLAVIGTTELIKRASDKDVKGVLTILAAVLVGILAAVFHDQLDIINLSVAQGIITGLSAAGVVTTATRIG